MGSFSEDSSVKNTFVIGIWAGVYLTTPSLLPPALNACYLGYVEKYSSTFRAKAFIVKQGAFIVKLQRQMCKMKPIQQKTKGFEKI
jgi:hypothetical protein